MFHIEFLGLPGAGKTTLNEGMRGRLRENGQACLSVNDALLCSLRKSRDDIIYHHVFRIVPDSIGRIVLNSLFIRSRYRFAAQNRFMSERSASLEVILRSGAFLEMSPKEKALALSRFLRTAIEYQVIKEQMKRQNVAIVFDEGFFQRGTSVFLSCTPGENAIIEGSVWQYFDAVPSPDLMILVEADLEKCAVRMGSRGLPGRLAHNRDSPLAAFLSHCQRYVDRVTEWAHKRGKPLLLITNNGLLEPAIEELSSKVLERIVRQQKTLSPS